MIKTLILIFSILGIVIAVLISFFEFSDKKKMVFICSGFAAFLTLLSLLFSQMQQQVDNAELNRINALLAEKTNELVNYSTGGTDNKPLPFLDLKKAPDGSTEVAIIIRNWGDQPLTNIFTQVTEYGSALSDYHKSKFFNKKSPRIEDSIQFKRYVNDNIGKVNFTENVSTLPTNGWRRIHCGEIDTTIKAVYYNILVMWNNRAYSILYFLARPNRQSKFSLINLQLKNQQEKWVDNINAFFPTAPAGYWRHAPQRLDTGNRAYDVYEFDGIN